MKSPTWQAYLWIAVVFSAFATLSLLAAGVVPLTGSQIGRILGKGPMSDPNVIQWKLLFLQGSAIAAGMTLLGALAAVIATGRARAFISYPRMAWAMAWDDARALASDLPHLVVLAIVLAFGALMLLLHSGRQLEYDEAFSFLVNADQGLGRVFGWYNVPNNHVMHSFAMWATTRAFGSAEWAVRLPAMIGAMLTMGLTYWVGRRWCSPTVGILAAGLLCASPYFIYYGTNGRGYTLQCACFLAQLLAVRYLLDTLPTRRCSGSFLHPSSR